jgi:hypothetical protein
VKEGFWGEQSGAGKTDFAGMEIGIGKMNRDS